MSRSYSPRICLSRVGLSRVVAVAVAAVTIATTAACGSDASENLSLPDLLITSDQMPANFTVATMTVDDLIRANRATLEQSTTVAFVPAECAPTADAAFNPLLNEGNSALLVGTAQDGTFSELISSVRRDIDADRRATTGPCRVVTATPSKGTLAGASIVTTTTELPAIVEPTVEQSFLVRSESRTTLPGGTPRARTGLMGNVLVKRPNGDVVTLQVGVSAQEIESPGGAAAPAPMSDAAFAELVRDAIARASR
ncbi:hypothetical protein [Gordonia sp. (in: high G+C Gram-positive bacteria)]|uniref:hypothetical protein n=1 Tax=Gordonia sp. (in: high G+C Gram-positive bacteria) TaxID=84139 RepID=UPI003C7242C9